MTTEKEKKFGRIPGPAVWLCCLWVLTILYGEMLTFWVPPLWSCSWPQLPNEMMNGVARVDDPVKVAVLADTQLTDKTSHNLPPKSLPLEILQFYTDLFMRRSFLQSVLPFKPDFILFLGDSFDGGHVLPDEEWQESLDRLKHIFNIDRIGRSSDIPTYYLPGNHDVGYASMHTQNPKVISRYEKEFGARNHRFSAGSVEFIVVDSQALDGSKHGNITSMTWDFVKNISSDDMLIPRVLLTYIPLYRPDWTPCGSQRSSPVINQRVSRSYPDNEITYQNYVSEETSSLLLELIRPVLVLSGHDHDQCTVIHQTRHGPITEHTVGTFSWQQGNFYPSFMLLSASAFSNTTISEKAVSTELCYLPMQTHIYIWYLFLFVFTVLLLLFWPPAGLGCWHQYVCFLESTGKTLRNIIKRDGVKEKDEDENCEYEMIWDAEGSMHLVKKVVKKAELTCSNVSPLVARGNVSVRPTAKKQISVDIDSSSVVELDKDIQSEDSRKLLPRSYRFKTSMVIRRLIRTSCLIMAIAAVNIPIYMMLLFKDWIEQ